MGKTAPREGEAPSYRTALCPGPQQAGDLITPLNPQNLRKGSTVKKIYPDRSRNVYENKRNMDIMPEKIRIFSAIDAIFAEKQRTN